jgi:hypothetical protein
MNVRLIDLHLANTTFDRRRAIPIGWRVLGIFAAGIALWLAIIWMFYLVFKSF